MHALWRYVKFRDLLTDKHNVPSYLLQIRIVKIARKIENKKTSCLSSQEKNPELVLPNSPKHQVKFNFLHLGLMES